MAFALVATLDGITALDADGTARPEWEGWYVSRLARGAAGCLAIADETRVLRRADDGSWNEVAESDANLISVYPFHDAALGGTIDGRLVQLDAHGAVPYTGFDAVDGRENWHAVPSGGPYVRSMTVTADEHALLV